MAIYDAFPYWAEKDDVLKCRFEVLWDVVDRFILVEMDKTHSGKPKEMEFDISKDRFSDYLDKLIHIVVKCPFPDNQLSWTLEHYQHDCIMHGLHLCGAQNQDTVTIAAADEICHPDALKEASERVKHGQVIAMDFKLFYYYLNNIGNTRWRDVKIVPYEVLTRIRPSEARFAPGNYLMPDAGWHFSYMGGKEFVQRKIQSFAHTEYDQEKFTNLDAIEKRIEGGQDLYGRFDETYTVIPVDETFPNYIQKNQEKLLQNGLLKAWKHDI